ncbi:MAG: NAD(P)H-hydrate dehydratase [Planctomycetota bacterium]
MRITTIDARTLPGLPCRRRDSHKGSFGRVAVVGGTRGMAGAVYLAGQGAARAGAGLVELVVPDRIADTAACLAPCAIIRALPADRGGSFAPAAARDLDATLAAADIVAAGPGLGTGPGAQAVVRRLVTAVDRPLVLDADGLNCLALMGVGLLARRLQPTVITPHPGEMARLTGKDIRAVQADRAAMAAALARATGAVVVLKGRHTVVTDGTTVRVNTTGNPGMATGGSGDVLTGIIAGLWASAGLSAFEAACAGCWVHGRAGDRAVVRVGEIALTALDIVDQLGPVFKRYPKQ